MNNAPWTSLGRLESDIQSLQQELRRKAESYEIHNLESKIQHKADNHETYMLSSRLDTLEHTCREIRTDIDGLLVRLQALEEKNAEIDRLQAAEGKHEGGSK